MAGLLSLFLAMQLLFLPGVRAQSQELSMNGEPQRARVMRGEYLYYSVTSLGEDVDIIITPLASGDPDLFASFDVEEPNMTDNSYSSRMSGHDAVTVPSPDWQGTGTLYIAVYGFSNATFSIVAVASSSVVQLSEGVPQYALVPQDGVRHYQFTLPDDTDGSFSGDVTISAVPVSGSIQIFVSNSMDTEINIQDSTSYSWSDVQTSGHAIILLATDPGFPQDGVFQIAVLGETKADFSIVITGSEGSTILRDGHAVQDRVHAGQFEYFEFEVDSTGCKLDITATPIGGNPDVYVSRSPKPNSTSYEYSSSTEGLDNIVIDNAEVGLYYLSVSSAAVSSFTLVAFTTCPENDRSEWVFLVDGLPQRSSLRNGNKANFKFPVHVSSGSSLSDVTISLSVEFGHAEMAVRTEEDGPAFFTSAGGVLEINGFDEHFCTSCVYYVTVEAMADSGFTVQARTSKAVAVLTDGSPLTDHLNTNEEDYYQIYVHDPNTELTISVTPLTRGDPDLFVSTGDIYAEGHTPNYTWSSRAYNGDSITIPSTDPNACGVCTYYVKVSAYSNVTFSVVASFSSPVTLQDGVPQMDSAVFGVMNYYFFRVRGPTGVVFSLTSISGRHRMYISNNTLPEYNVWDSYNPRWSPTAIDSMQQTFIEESDPAACHHFRGCVYHVGIRTESPNGTYTLTASKTGSRIMLLHGIATRHTLAAGERAYFETTVESEGLDLSIIASPIAGDALVLIVSTTNKTPDEQDFERYTTGVVNFDNAARGTYYIAVIASINTRFDITAMASAASSNTTADLRPLICGEPVSGYLHEGRYAYFSQDETEGTDELFIALAKDYGDPDMYISNNGVFPDRRDISTYEWSSMQYAADSIRIPNPLGHYIIAVYAYATSQYSLTASCKFGVSTLQNGVPLRGELGGDQWRYYKAQVDANEKDITFAVTAYAGDPDLYLGFGYKPNATNYDESATEWKGDSITIPYDSDKFQLGTYYIGVLSYSTCTYAIQYSVDGVVTLKDGHPQFGSVANEAFFYAAFTPNVNHTDITFDVTPISGNVRLFVSVDKQPTESDYQWSAYSPHLIIRDNDEAYCSNCTYFVGVYGSSDCDFTLLASTSGAGVILQDNFPTTGWIERDRVKHFQFDVRETDVDVIIMLTAMTGDPDLYVSTTDKWPTKETHEWASIQYGSDAIEILNTKPSTYFITVLGFLNNSTFTLVAQTSTENDDEVLSLVDGIPQTGFVRDGQYRYYSFRLSSDQPSFMITVTRQIGEPDLYVSNTDQKPTANFSVWNSTLFGEDSITIEPATAGIYTIAVYGFSTSEYSIVAVTSAAQQTLSDGIPFTRVLSEESPDYFVIFIDSWQEDLTITVTSLGSGDPDLFVGVEPHPDAETAQYSARAYGSDSITIPSTEIHYGPYYISVSALSSMTYTIVASFSRMQRLTVATPQAGTVLFEQSRYYYFEYGDDYEDVTITLTPTNGGRAFMYVSAFSEPEIDKPDTFQWESKEWSTQSLSIRRAEQDAITNNTYALYIMVYGASTQSTDYTLSLAYGADSLVLLQHGVAQFAVADAETFSDFSFIVDSTDSDITFALTPMAGLVRLSVRAGGPNGETWTESGTGACVVKISSKHDNFYVGTYLVSVVAVTNASYSIVASLDSDAITLVDGRPQAGRVRCGNISDANKPDEDLYRFVTPADTEVTLDVRPEFGDPQLTVTDQNGKQWHAGHRGRDSLMVPCGKDEIDGCVLSVSVTCVRRLYLSSLFSLVATTGDAVVALQLGVPYMNTMNSDEDKQYFSVLVPEDATGRPLMISVTSLTGGQLTIDVYKHNQITSRPDWTGSNIVTIDGPESGMYYVGLDCHPEESTDARTCRYSVTATMGAVQLHAGEPHSDHVAAGAIKYYSITIKPNDRPDDEAAFLKINVNVFDNGKVVIVADPTLEYPTEATATWASTNSTLSSYQNQLTLPECVEECTYHIGVMGVLDTMYAINAHYGGVDLILMDGYSVTDTVKQGETRYFRAYVESMKSDTLEIVTYTFYGNIDLFVSDRCEDDLCPTQETAVWQSDQGHLSIGKNALSTGPLYIGVVGVEESKFAISYSTLNSVNLRNGVPQHAYAQPKGTFFSYLVNFVNNTKEDITFSVTPDGGGQGLDIYVSATTTQPGPGKTGIHWVGKYRPGTTSTSVVVSAGHPEACGACQYYVGVYGSTSQEETHQSFLLTASSADAIQVISDGDVVDGQVIGQQYKYYEMYVASASKLLLLLETCEGDGDLYVARRYPDPSKAHYQWSSSDSDRDDWQEINDGTVSDASFYLGVYGKEDSSYKLRVSTQAGIDDGPQLVTPVIQVALEELGEVTLIFHKAESTGMEGDILKYSVYYALHSSKIVLYSKCGLEKWGTLVDTFEGDDQKVFTRAVQGLDEGTEYSFSVLVEDSQGRYKVYSPEMGVTTLSPEIITKGGVDLKLVLGIAIPVSVIVVGICIWMCRRNRKLTAELAVEMSEVPGPALRKAVRGPPGARAPGGPGKHSQLLDDDVEDASEDVGDYAPNPTTIIHTADDEEDSAAL